MTRGGRKSHFATYYFHLEPGNSFAGGGIWQPAGPALKAMRNERSARVDRQGKADFTMDASDKSGKIVIDAKHVNYGFAEKK